jgi:reverse gyrase
MTKVDREPWELAVGLYLANDEVGVRRHEEVTRRAVQEAVKSLTFIGAQDHR